MEIAHHIPLILFDIFHNPCAELNLGHFCNKSWVMKLCMLANSASAFMSIFWIKLQASFSHFVNDIRNWPSITLQVRFSISFSLFHLDYCISTCRCKVYIIFVCRSKSVNPYEGISRKNSDSNRWINHHHHRRLEFRTGRSKFHDENRRVPFGLFGGRLTRQKRA